MGITYKLKPEIVDFILEQKKNNQVLSCRVLSRLIEEKFHLTLSKSSINNIIKTAGLSMPVGRRLKKRRRSRIQMPALPVIEALPAPPLPAVEPKIEALAPLPETQVTPSEIPVIPLEAPIIPAAPPEEKVEVSIVSPSEERTTAAILLKAADYLIGGSCVINEAIKKHLHFKAEHLLERTSGLIFRSLFEAQPIGISGLNALLSGTTTFHDLDLYLNELQGVRAMDLVWPQILDSVLKEVNCLKIVLEDKSSFYLDGQFYSLWPTPHIPPNFSTTTYNITSYINRIFKEFDPFVLFSAPGSDGPPQELFEFIKSLDPLEKKVTQVVLYGDKFSELETKEIETAKKRFCIFGLWPWQFVEYRKVKKLGEFQPFHFEPLNKEFFIAEIEIELFQPYMEQEVTFKGCALKNSLSEKTRLVVLSTLIAPPEKICQLYLSHWPNLEEGFQDYSRKLEFFTYTGASASPFSLEALEVSPDLPLEINTLFTKYLEALDLYVKFHFLPQGYETQDLQLMKKQLYAQEVLVEHKDDYLRATIRLAQEHPLRKDLQYACCRLNEREILSDSGKRIWFSV